jgi:hypothetical protein
MTVKVTPRCNCRHFRNFHHHGFLSGSACAVLFCACMQFTEAHPDDLKPRAVTEADQ